MKNVGYYASSSCLLFCQKKLFFFFFRSPGSFVAVYHTGTETPFVAMLVANGAAKCALKSATGPFPVASP